MILRRLLPAGAELPPRSRAFVRGLAMVMLAGVSVHLLYTGTGVGGGLADAVVNRWGQNVFFAAAVALCGLRVRTASHARGAHLALTVGVALYAAGNLYYSAVLWTVQEPPFPSPADVGWLAFYVPAYVCLGLMVRDSVRRFHRSVWLDGLVATLAVAAAGAAVVVIPILRATEGTTAAVVTVAAYPLADLVLLSLTMGVVALHGWRGRGLLLLAAGLAAFAAADSIHLYWIAYESFHPGTLLDSLWLVGAALMALAAWQRPQTTGAVELGSGAMLVMPLAFGLGALALLTYDAFHE